MNRVVIASWLFLIGSIVFLIDAIVDVTAGVSFMSVSEILEGFLFLTGSIFFMPEPQKERSNILD